MNSNDTYRTKIEDIEVDVFYDFEEGDNGDYWTPPTPWYLEVLEWEFVDKNEREKHTDLDDEEWQEVVDEIQWWIDHRVEEEILKKEDERIAEREQTRIERRRRRW